MKKNFYVYLYCLVLLFILYYCFRSILGWELVNDEIYYLNGDYTADSRRGSFMRLAQFFQSPDLNILGIVFINFIAFIGSFYFLSKINFGNYLITFLQMMYVSAIANYVLRDTLLYFFVILVFYQLFQVFDKKNTLSLNNYFLRIITLIMSIIIVSQLRIQYTLTLITSFSLAYIFYKFSSKTIFFIIFFLVLILSYFGYNILFEYRIMDIASFLSYDESLYEFIQLRSERRDYEVSLFGIVTLFIKHIFAPIPTSLLWRIATPEIWNDYGLLDDIYRFFYRVILYFLIIFICLNIMKIKKLFNENKFAFIMLITFSLQNVILYSLFGGGGGHERVKIFSVFPIYYLTSLLIEQNFRKKNE